MDLLVEEKFRVLQLTLNRPSKRNALTSRMCADIVDQVRAAQRKDSIGAILLGATGQVFSAGMDLDEASHLHGSELADLHDDLFSLGTHSLKPIIVCVNGPALGGGLGLVAQGHLVVASDGAVFGLTEIRVGLWPFLVYRSVEEAVGSRRTLELSLTGRVFPSEDALQWGLVHFVCPAAEISERASGLARDVAKRSPTAIEAGLEYYHGSRGKPWKDAGQLAKELRKRIMEGDDFKEGYAAFKEKREPNWPSLREQNGAQP